MIGVTWPYGAADAGQDPARHGGPRQELRAGRQRAGPCRAGRRPCWGCQAWRQAGPGADGWKAYGILSLEEGIEVEAQPLPLEGRRVAAESAHRHRESQVLPARDVPWHLLVQAAEVSRRVRVPLQPKILGTTAAASSPVRVRASLAVAGQDPAWRALLS